MKILFTLLFSATTIFLQAQSTQQKQTITLEGTCVSIEAGSCSMSSKPRQVKIVLLIDESNGKVTGQEFFTNSNGQFELDEGIAWSGEVLNAQALRLQQSRVIQCGTEERTEILHFIGVIKYVEGQGYKIKLTDTYAMCPSANCIFDIEYDLLLK